MPFWFRLRSYDERAWKTEKVLLGVSDWPKDSQNEKDGLAALHHWFLQAIGKGASFLRHPITTMEVIAVSSTKAQYRAALQLVSK